MVTLWIPQVFRRFPLVYNLFPVVSKVALKISTPKSFAKTFLKTETMFSEVPLPVEYATFPQLK